MQHYLAVLFDDLGTVAVRTRDFAAACAWFAQALAVCTPLAAKDNADRQRDLAAMLEAARAKLGRKTSGDPQ